MKLYPAILTESIETLREQLIIAQDLPNVEVVQIDILDGKFADALTVTPADFPEVAFGELLCDLHLMTEEPLDYVFELANAAEDLPIRAVIGQVERMSNQEHFLEEVQRHGWYPGLSLDIFTPIDAINFESWRYLQVVQLMAVEAGAQGQALNPLIFDKVMELRTRMQVENTLVEIVVDGGVSAESIARLEKVGVQAVAVGSALWKARDPHQALSNIMENTKNL